MLTDKAVRALAPREKAYKVVDTGGLYVYVLSSGGISWRYDYRFSGKRKTLAFGTYPALSLAMARKALAEAKEQLAHGIDPSEQKKITKIAIKAETENTFEAIAADWITTKKSDKTPKHIQDIQSKLERFVYPTLKGRAINSITAKEILETVRKVEDKGLFETTKKVLGICSQIFAFAVGEGKAEINICAGLSSQLKSRKVSHYAFVTDKKLLGQILRDIDEYPHGRLVGIALQLIPLVFTRPSELVEARWEEISFEDALWTIPAHRMKLRRPHLVPLSKQSLRLLKELYSMTGDTDYLFANWNNRDKPITTDGVRQGLRKLGYGADIITTHGFRHTASTLLNEQGFLGDHVEAQLAHTEGRTVRGTYNHAQYLPQRRDLMQSWADFLEELKRKA